MKRRPKDFRDYEDWTEEDFEEDLFTNAHYQSYFKNFDADSVTSFIKDYASRKFNIHEHLR